MFLNEKKCADRQEHAAGSAEKEKIMLSDIEIAQRAEMYPIGKVAAELSIEEEDIEYYGHYKAKLSEQLFKKLDSKPDGKLILVTAINPTPAGEGKTTVSVGLADALHQIGKKTILALREPSLGPVFGIKGGAAGGGYAWHWKVVSRRMRHYTIRNVLR